jgi:hypothetical protein
MLALIGLRRRTEAIAPDWIAGVPESVLLC